MSRISQAGETSKKVFCKSLQFLNEFAIAMLGSTLQVHPKGTWRKEVFGKMGKKQQ